MDPVQNLPPGIAAYLRSSVNITSLASVVEQLLKNALDANAHHIRVNLNLEQWSLTVQDDGAGIDGSQLEAVGRRYYTSKTLQTHDLTPLESFGYRGEALASIAEMSCFEIISRRKSAAKSLRKRIEYGRQVSFGEIQHFNTDSSGTTVHVTGIFAKVPVRRNFGSRQSRLRSIITIAETIALGNPGKGLTITLQTDNTDALSTNTTLLNIAASLSELKLYRQIFGDNMIKNSKLVTAHVPYQAGSMGIKVSGIIGQVDVVTRSRQYIYMNGLKLERCDLYEVVEDTFNDSVKTPAEPIAQQTIRPMFVLRIKMTSMNLDVGHESCNHLTSSQRYSTIKDALRMIVKKLLRTTDNPPASRSGRQYIPDTTSSDRLSAAHTLAQNEIATVREKLKTSHPSYLQPSVEGSELCNISFAQKRPVIIWNTELTKFSRRAETSTAKIGGAEHVQARLLRDIVIHKDCLRRARVISQFDLKYIICHITLECLACGPSESYSQGASCARPTTAIVAIDQHAAHERVRVEFLQNQLCRDFLFGQQKSFLLERSEDLVLSPDDSETLSLLPAIRNILARWGIEIQDDDGKDTSSSTKCCMIGSIPSIVRNRLQFEPKQVKKIVQRYIHSLMEDPAAVEAFLDGLRPDHPTKDCIEVLRWCPIELQDYMNSNACRGAIMFNDALDLSRCQDLINDLSATASPFTCAHGRPSLTVLHVSKGCQGSEQHETYKQRVGRARLRHLR